jgi:hypothetical protein
MSTSLVLAVGGKKWPIRTDREGMLAEMKEAVDGNTHKEYDTWLSRFGVCGRCFVRSLFGEEF